MNEPNDNARIKISLESGELEVEGPQAFLNKYEGVISSLLERLVNQTPKINGPSSRPAPVIGAPLEIDSFPEALHGMVSTSGTDQIFVAGHFASQASHDGTFSTGEANKLLLEQGIKLPNPSQSLKNNLTAKRVFKAGSKFKISKTGSDHLRTLVRGVGI
jgi:hypothetical protein